MAKGYTNKATIENLLSVNIDSSMDAQITRWIEAAEKEIDEVTGRNFIADPLPTERLFDGDNTGVLVIDDCIEVINLYSAANYLGDGPFTLIDPANYLFNPNNYNKDGKPIRGIILKNDFFVRGIQNYKVEAKWGFSENVPADIELVATSIVAGILNEAGNTSSKIKSEKIGDYAVSFDVSENSSLVDEKGIKAILSRYVKPAL